MNDMNDLNKALNKLEAIYKKEQAKKRRLYNLKEEEEEYVELSNYSIKTFLKMKQQHQYKETLRLKSLRTAKKPKKLSEDFDNKYKQQQVNMFKKPWNKLTKQMKLNRLYRYMKIRQNELELDINEYNTNLELIKDKLDLNGLRKDIEYDEENGEIKNCWLFDEKPKKE